MQYSVWTLNVDDSSNKYLPIVVATMVSTEEVFGVVRFSSISYNIGMSLRNRTVSIPSSV